VAGGDDCWCQFAGVCRGVCVAVCFSMLQCGAAWCVFLREGLIAGVKCVNLCCSVLQGVAVGCLALQGVEVGSSVLPCVVFCCSVL